MRLFNIVILFSFKLQPGFLKTTILFKLNTVNELNMPIHYFKLCINYQMYLLKLE